MYCTSPCSLGLILAGLLPIYNCLPIQINLYRHTRSVMSIVDSAYAPDSLGSWLPVRRQQSGRFLPHAIAERMTSIPFIYFRMARIPDIYVFQND